MPCCSPVRSGSSVWWCRICCVLPESGGGLRTEHAVQHRLLLPLCALAGGVLLTLADTFARTVAAPLEFPVGAMTALIGVPVLLFLLAKTR